MPVSPKLCKLCFDTIWSLWLLQKVYYWQVTGLTCLCISYTEHTSRGSCLKPRQSSSDVSLSSLCRRETVATCRTAMNSCTYCGQGICCSVIRDLVLRTDAFDWVLEVDEFFSPKISKRVVEIVQSNSAESYFSPLHYFSLFSHTKNGILCLKITCDCRWLRWGTEWI